MFTLHTLGGTLTAINPDHVVRVVAVPADDENPIEGSIIFLSVGSQINTAVPFAQVVDSVAKGRA